MEAVLSGLRAVSCVVYVMEVGGCVFVEFVKSYKQAEDKKDIMSD